MTATNLLLKINHKLGGVNCEIAEKSRINLFDKPVMVMAASLSHSMAGGPTVAAISVSTDRAGSKYMGYASLQEKTHIIEQMKDLAKKALKDYYQGHV